ncbi:MAG: DUF4153 domain-containing protein [Pedobacter sp.]|nr:MAG: DUF4153 domain-containing protein [Pedobacter sp.]
MKLPSISILIGQFWRVLTRFPLQVLLAIVSTLLWCYLISLPNQSDELGNQLGKLLIVFNLLFTLSLSSDLFSESKGYSMGRTWLFRVLSIILCIGIYFLIDPFNSRADLFRVFFAVFSFHLLVAFAPFIGNSSLLGFWQYNKTIFLRILTAAFYALVLFAGLAGALAAVEGLFNVNIPGRAYTQLFALVTAGFASIFFLAGIPSDFSRLAEDYAYPKGLKIFTQYVLIPLMTIYLAILLVYEIKIIMIWSLPKGIVSSLILGYTVFGILSLLLIYPIKDDVGNGWMRLFSKFFYLTMIPLIVLLFLAITKRVGTYGITEPRYILMVLAIWITAISAYFLFSKKQNIKVIPISLCLTGILILYGPQSASSMAKQSQIARLERFLKDNSYDKERSAVVRYLVSNHGLVSLQKFTKTDLKEIEKKIEKSSIGQNTYSYQTRERKIDTAFSLLKIKDDSNSQAFQTVSIKNANMGVVELKGYDAIFAFDEYIDQAPKQFNGLNLVIERLPDNLKVGSNNILKVELGKEGQVIFNLKDVATVAFRKQQADELEQVNDKKGFFYGYIYPSDKLVLVQETSNYEFTLVVKSMSGEYDQKRNELNYFNFGGSLLIKKKVKTAVN